MVFLYFIISLTYVILYVLRSILVVKDNKLLAAAGYSICYVFYAVVVKFIAQSDIYTAIISQAITSFLGCYIGKTIYEWYEKYQNNKKQD